MLICSSVLQDIHVLGVVLVDDLRPRLPARRSVPGQGTVPRNSVVVFTSVRAVPDSWETAGYQIRQTGW